MILTCKNEKTKNLFPLYLLFFTSTDTVLFGTNSKSAFLYVPRIIAILVSLYLLFFTCKGTLKNGKRLTIALMLIFFLCLSGIFNHMELGTTISRIIMICVAYMITEAYALKDYVKAFDNAMYLVAVVALLTEIIAYIAPGLFSFFPTVVNTANYSFSVFLIGSMRYSFLGNSLIRAGGIFWEPGAFAIYLVIAVMFQLFFSLKINIKRLIVYISAILFTFSTTGYIALAFLFGVFLIKNNENVLAKRVKELIVLLIIFLITLVVFHETLFNMIFGKIVNNESTTIWRYASFFSGLLVSIKHPFLGVGANNLGVYVSEMSELLGFGAAYSNISNTLVYQFAAYGLIYGLIYSFGLFKFFKNNFSNCLIAVGLFIVMFLLYFGEVFFSFFPLVFVLYGYSKNNRRKMYFENISN
jgi:hypothetical protein